MSSMASFIIYLILLLSIYFISIYCKEKEFYYIIKASTFMLDIFESCALDHFTTTQHMQFITPKIISPNDKSVLFSFYKEKESIV